MEDQKLSSIEQSKQTNEDIYDSTLSNVVTIDRHHTVSYYINICTIILRTQEEVIVIGAGNNCDIAVSTAAALEKRKLGELTSIRTGMDISSHFGSPNSQWTQPLAMMTFYLRPGENGKYISGYRQRKIIELFEKYDVNVTGYLTINQIQSFKLENVFMSNQTQKENANKFLLQLKNQQQSMNLPSFIKYSSLLIHPLLKPQKFNDALWSAFKL
eukprot:91098_1